jgi:hypothetical protein
MAFLASARVGVVVFLAIAPCGCAGRVQQNGSPPGGDAGAPPPVCQDVACIATLESDPYGFSALTVDHGTVYAARIGDPDTGAILEIPADGGASSVVVSTPTFGTSFGLVVDGPNVYASASAGFVFDAPIGGAAAASVLVSAGHDFWGIALDAQFVYWSTADDPGAIEKVPRSGGASTILATVHASPRKVLVDDESVYWIGGAPGDTLSSVSKSGGAPTVLATSTVAGMDMVKVGDSIYWITFGGTQIFQTPATPARGGPTTTFASGFGLTYALATDGESVYVADFDGSVVQKVPIGGGTAVAVAQVYHPYLLAVDDTSVYVASDLSLMRVTPK